MISFKNPFRSTHWLILQKHGAKQKVMGRKKENNKVCRPLIHQDIRPGMQTFIQPSEDDKQIFENSFLPFIGHMDFCSPDMVTPVLQ